MNNFKDEHHEDGRFYIYDFKFSYETSDEINGSRISGRQLSGIKECTFLCILCKNPPRKLKPIKKLGLLQIICPWCNFSHNLQFSDLKHQS